MRWTALMLAAQHGHEAAALALIKAGADTAAVNNKGQTALDIATKFGQHKIVRILARAAQGDKKKKK